MISSTVAIIALVCAGKLASRSRQHDAPDDPRRARPRQLATKLVAAIVLVVHVKSSLSFSGFFSNYH